MAILYRENADKGTAATGPFPRPHPGITDLPRQQRNFPSCMFEAVHPVSTNEDLYPKYTVLFRDSSTRLSWYGYLYNIANSIEGPVLHCHGNPHIFKT